MKKSMKALLIFIAISTVMTLGVLAFASSEDHRNPASSQDNYSQESVELVMGILAE